MGRQGDRQGELMVMWSEMPRSPGHVFYDRLQKVLVGAGFDGFVEEACRAFYAKTMGAPSVRPGRWMRLRRCKVRRPFIRPDRHRRSRSTNCRLVTSSSDSAQYSVSFGSAV